MSYMKCQAEANPRPDPQPNAATRVQAFRYETWAAALATGFIAVICWLITLNAGPLWRDEINTINIAQMPSLKLLWHYVQFESFPPLYVLLLRAWSLLGMAGTDEGIRVLGLFIGLLFLGSLWLCSKWVWGGAPTLSMALLGSLPAVAFTVTSNRAYGLSLCLLIWTFAAVWRVLERPSKTRTLLATAICFLFAHCVYYNAIFLGAILFAAAMIAVRRRHWRLLGVFAGIGVGSVASLTIYLPAVRRASGYMPMFQAPQFSFGFLLDRLNEAIAFQGSAQQPVPSGTGAISWLTVLLLALGIGVGVQSGRFRLRKSCHAHLGPSDTVAADLALFGIISLIGGIVGQMSFLLNLHYPTQSWYYVGMLTLCAICLEAVLGATCRAWHPYGLARVGFLVVTMALGWKGVWEEAHTRRSNVDVIATVLGSKAASRDLIVVQTAWEGITFNRYYYGKAKWQTLPPLASHEVHRLDLMWAMLNATNSISPVLAQAVETLKSGGAVWVVGKVRLGSGGSAASPLPLPPALPTRWWLGAYSSDWGEQLLTLLVINATENQKLDLQLPMPVNYLENLPIMRFSGYRVAIK